MTGCVIFDLDGTLVDSAGICAAIVNEMLAERGRGETATLADARRWSSVGGPAMIAALLGEHCGDPAAEIADFRRRYAIRPTPAGSLFAGVEAGLRTLHAHGLRLAICSNKPQPLCEKVLSDCGLDSLFDCVVGGMPGRQPKPHPDLLDRTLAGLGAQAAACLYVGDSEIDHEVAAARAIPFLFMTHGYAAPGWDAPGLTRLDRFDDAVDHILSRRGLA